MKHLTITLLTLLILGGCATTEGEDVNRFASFSDDDLCNWKYKPNQQWGSLRSLQFRLNEYSYLLEESYERVINCQSYIKSRDLDSTSWMEELVFVTHRNQLDISRMNKLLNLRAKYEDNLPLKIQKEQERMFALQKKSEEILLLKKQALLKSRKDKCRTYGFKDKTDGMGLCLIELDKLAKLESQMLAIERGNNQVYLQNQQLIEDQKKQREAQALINLGAVISGAGIPKTNTPKAPITTYPNSFSSTLTIPSNQMCPILSTPITKQEVRGTNRICYYK